MRFERQENSHKIILISTAILSVLTVILAVFDGIYVIKRLHCMNTIQKSLPTIKAASKRYLELNEELLTSEKE